MNNNIKILSIAIVAVAIVGVGLFFTKEEKPKEEIVPIRLLDSTAPSEFEIAKKLTGRDTLEEEGVKLEIITAQSTGAVLGIQAVMAKHIDIAGGSLSSWISAIASGAKLKVVVGGNMVSKDNPGNGFVVLENSSIYTVKDIVGKKIAINTPAASGEFIAKYYLKLNGLSTDQVQIVVVPSAQIEQVLRSRQVDVAAWTMGGGVDFEMAMDRGGLRELPDTRRYDIWGDTMSTAGAGFREDFIKEHPETVRRYATAVEKSRRIVLDEFQKDPARVKKAYAEIAEEKGSNPKLAKYYTPNFAIDHPFIDKDIQWWIDIMEYSGVLKPGQIKPSDVYTNEFNPYYKK